jgi:hypothetical protein
VRQQQTPPHVKALDCPNCGGTVQLRGMAHTLTVVCIQCLSVLDAKDPGLRVLQKFQARERIRPLIPLGTRGKLHGTAYEVIGFQAREIEVDGVAYQWREYLLFNPYKGFRYLSEYNGHWNDIVTLKGLPQRTKVRGRPAAKWLDRTFRHFQTATARTVYVMGEFPWRVQVGETVRVSDYVAPPFLLSSEEYPGEITWSEGEYRTGKFVWEHFNLPGSPPVAYGVFANQPSPHDGRVASVWKFWLAMMGLLFLVLCLTMLLMQNKVVFERTYSFSSAVGGEQSFVTPVFEIEGRDSNVEVETRTNLDNQWMYVGFALINDETGEAWDFGREISYYHGRDSDGSWSEGSRTDAATLSPIPAGRYYLRVEPESDPAQRWSIQYQIIVRRDVPGYWMFGLGIFLLLIPPVVVTIRRHKFESARWAESDYAPSGDDD